MSDLVLPGGAFPECAKLETAAIKRPDGKDATAFASRAEALAAMRKKTIELEQRLVALEAQAMRPFGGSSSPGA